MTGTPAKRGLRLMMAQVWVAVQARHQDVAEDQVRLVVADLGQGVEAVLGQHDLVAALLEEDLGAAPDGVAVVDHQDLDGAGVGGRGIAHGLGLLGSGGR